MLVKRRGSDYRKGLLPAHQLRRQLLERNLRRTVVLFGQELCADGLDAPQSYQKFRFRVSTTCLFGSCGIPIRHHLYQVAARVLQALK